jgi:hypothetical protein
VSEAPASQAREAPVAEAPEAPAAAAPTTTPPQPAHSAPAKNETNDDLYK